MWKRKWLEICWSPLFSPFLNPCFLHFWSFKLRIEVQFDLVYLERFMHLSSSLQQSGSIDYYHHFLMMRHYEPVSGGLEPRIFMQGDSANYSACRKYSQCFMCSKFSHVTALFQNKLNSFFTSDIYTEYPLMTKRKKFVWNSCKFI